MAKKAVAKTSAKNKATTAGKAGATTAGKKATGKAVSKASAKKTTKRSSASGSASGKTLVIVESPAKAKTINKFLGPGYVIKASMGHVRDLLTKGTGKARFGIDIENDFAPVYGPIKAKEKTLAELKKAADSASAILLAPDPDREGEAIAWHLAEALELPPEKTRRVTFNAITKSAVTKAIESPRDINMDLVNAQQARRVLDRLVGFSLSPLLWKMVTKGLSAGRVQSVAVRMVVEREKDIAAFTAEEFWRMTALLSGKDTKFKKDQFLASLIKWDGSSLADGAILDDRDVSSWGDMARFFFEAEKDTHSPFQKAWALFSPEAHRKLAAIPEGKLPEDLAALVKRETMRAMAQVEFLNIQAAAELPLDERGRELLDHAETPSAIIERNRRALEAACPSIVTGRLALRISTEKDALSIREQIEASPFVVADLTEKETQSRASAPFITSTLQQAASTWLGSGSKKTMQIAQQLYEGIEIAGNLEGLITYMRTDSTRISGEGLAGARGYIAEHFSAEYLPDEPNFFGSKKGAQDAHEAIRPTHPDFAPEDIRQYLTPDQFKLYDLIWRRFIASQMSPAQYLNTIMTIDAGKATFEARGRKVLFDGFTAVWSVGKKKNKKADDGTTDEDATEDQLLPHVNTGDPLSLLELTAEEKATRPPSRYSEASLIKALEREGIGRPSTYQTIVTTIQDRGYARLEKRYFHATELGTAVTGLLEEGFPDIMDYHFTASMESDLDHVEEGTVDWVKMLNDFYRPFEKSLERAGSELQPLKGKPAPDGERCPECEAEMQVRYSINGAFLSCTRYPECKGTRPLDNLDEEDPDAEPVECPTCGAPMAKKRGRFGVFYACSQAPECKQTVPVGKDGAAVKLPKIDLACEKCGKPMVAKMGRRGVFAACTGYPDCKNAKPIGKDGAVIHLPNITGTCEKCGGEMVVRMSRMGPFLGCTAYPKCRNAKKIPKEAKDGDHIDFAKIAAEEKAAAGDTDASEEVETGEE